MRIPLVVALLLISLGMSAQTPKRIDVLPTDAPQVRQDGVDALKDVRFVNLTNSLTADFSIQGNHYRVKVANISVRRINSYAIGCAGTTITELPPDGLGAGESYEFDIAPFLAPMLKYQSAYTQPKFCTPVQLQAALFDDGGSEGKTDSVNALKLGAQAEAADSKDIIPILDHLEAANGTAEDKVAAVEVSIKELEKLEQKGSRVLLLQELRSLLKEVTLLAHDEVLRQTDIIDRRISAFTSSKRKAYSRKISAAATQSTNETGEKQ